MNDNPEKESRKFIRHEADLPIEISLENLVAHKREYLNDIGFGGLSFKAKEEVEVGTLINIKIPLLKPMFEAVGKVIWCRKEGDVYFVGVKFTAPADGFKMRMLEQICHIDAYKKELRKELGRHVTGEEAAIEWIKIFADKFPKDPDK